MKTGLLSLNIHDSLTFDGTELCLHPDIFSIPGDVIAPSSQHTISSRKGDEGKTSGATAISGNTTVASSHVGLSVGDMIEIRVWDPLPKEQALLRSPGTSPSLSMMRKNRTPLSTTATTSSTSVHVEFPMPTTGSTKSTPASSTYMGRSTSGSTTLRSRADSLAYSTGDTNNEEQQDSVFAAADGDTSMGANKYSVSLGAESVASGKSIASIDLHSTTPSEPSHETGPDDSASIETPPTSKQAPVTPNTLPPVFPRSRASTTDAGPSTTLKSTVNPTMPKPPLIHRRATSGSASTLASHPNSPKFSKGHARNISDMTMDTHHLDIIESGINHTESNEDDEHGAFMGGDVWSKVSTTHKLRLSFVLLVTDTTLTTLKGNTRTQVSMLRQVADLYSLSSYDMITVHKIDPHDHNEVLKAVSADFVVMTIKDQFISRGDMHLFQRELQGSWIYEGQRLSESNRQIKSHALEIRHGNDVAKSGIITDKTMITFRSRSARIVWLVQLSSEMWDYSSPYDHKGEPHSICETYFDQWVRFLYKLFEKWKNLEVTHSLTIVFFSRTFLSSGAQSISSNKDVHGRFYEDHYKPIVENETRTEWVTLIARIKEEFINYPLEVGWNLTDRRPSSASQGNVLEAVNVALNLMQYHFLDRDLYRSGNSIVVVSPGCGTFEVEKELAGITYQRMMDNGIGSDMLSLGLPPLHIAPFFLYNNEFKNVETKGVDTNKKYYEVPHWMHLSFISYDREDHQLGDHVHHEDMISPTVKQEGLDSFELGPHGFLRPKAETEARLNSQYQNMCAKSSSTFSALGNKAATPGKAKAQQERQLISGRDFRDILEACRPRVSGIRLPSALVSILKLRDFQNERDVARSNALDFQPHLVKEEPSHSIKNVSLREWGTIGFDEFSIRPKSRGRTTKEDSPKSRQSPGASTKMEKPGGSDSGSNASSLMSHVSSVFGMSYDRVLWDHYDSPLVPKTVFKIQRPPSLDLEPLLRTSSSSPKEGYSGNQSTVLSGLPSTQREKDTSIPSNNLKKQKKGVSTLRSLMDTYDDHIWAPIVSKVPAMADINSMRPEPTQNGHLEVALSANKCGQNKSGGLGAALSQYTSMGTTKDINNATKLTRRASGGYLSNEMGGSGNFERKRANSPLFEKSTPFSDRVSRTMSPMLIPIPSLTLHGKDTPRNLGIGKAPNNRLVVGDSAIPMMHGSFGFLSSDGSSQKSLLSKTSAGGINRESTRQESKSPPTVGSPQNGATSSIISHFDRVPLKTGRGRSPSEGATFQPKTQRPKKLESRSKKQSSLSLSKQHLGKGPSSPQSKIQKGQKSKKRDVSASRRLQQKACNPFRQSDEDEVLAKRSHNRRRWSHVFPAGEIEFKRHSGPIWNSLTAPAILPLSVDYLPSPQELRDEAAFQFNPYTVTLSGIENTQYASHEELLLEMVRQRVSQDFQIVTDNAVRESENRSEPQRKGRGVGKVRPTTSRREPFVRSLPTIKDEKVGAIKHYLSMGHRIQVLTYDSSADTIEIVHYTKKSAQNDPINVYNYRFMVYSHTLKSYSPSLQTFKKYADPYKWNMVDNLICGEEDRQLEVGMRFRRVMFGLIPEAFEDTKSEEEYISKFRRLLDYLGKLREKDSSDQQLDVSITSYSTVEQSVENILKIRRPTEESMIKFTIPLKRRKSDPFEWMEIALDAVFDTKSSYRIMFNWLVASSAKVETQVQLFQRRCSLFGLKIMSFPQTTISRDLLLHSLAIPALFTIRSKRGSTQMVDELKEMNFIADGVRFTDGQILDFVENGKDYDFPKYGNGKMKAIPCRQFVHRSGALFIRCVRDLKGWSIFVGLENHRHASRENKFHEIAVQQLSKISRAIQSISVSEENLESKEENRS